MAKGTNASQCYHCGKHFLCGDCIRSECGTCRRIHKLATRYFDYDQGKVALWFRSPNPVIDDMSPNEFLRTKNPQILLDKMGTW